MEGVLVGAASGAVVGLPLALIALWVSRDRRAFAWVWLVSGAMIAAYVAISVNTLCCDH